MKPIRGLIFQKEKSPLIGFVDSLYEKRVEAKQQGKRAFQLMYKLILLSLYGRFGLRPDSAITQVCDYSEVRAITLLFQTGKIVQIAENQYVVTYKRIIDPLGDVNKKENKALLDQMEEEERKNFVRLRYSNTAVHLAAAVTGYSRIYMYPFIQNENVLYTDTDSLITTTPLEEEHISKSILGKFKLEAQNVHYIGIAPKLYALRYEDGSEKVVKSGWGKEEASFQKIHKLFLQISKENNPGGSSKDDKFAGKCYGLAKAKIF